MHFIPAIFLTQAQKHSKWRNTKIKVLKLRIFSKSPLREFLETHADAEQHLKTWYETFKNADWKSPADVNLTYANVSINYSGCSKINPVRHLQSRTTIGGFVNH